MSIRTDVADAMRQLGIQLATARAAADLIQHQLAGRVSYSRSTVANAETGRQIPPRSFWAKCDEVLDTGRSLAEGYDHVMALIKQQRTDAAAAARIAHTAVPYRWRDGAGWSSDDGLPALAAVTSSTYLPVPCVDDGRLGSRDRASMTVDSVDARTAIAGLSVEGIHDLVRRLSVEYLSDDPMSVYGRTTAIAEVVFELVQGYPKPTHARELYLAAGYLYTLLGWMAGDLGDRDRATVYNRTGWLCAEVADHDTLRAWVLSTMSKTALWEGRLSDAESLAARGSSHAAGGTVAVLLACQQADARAEMGAAQPARRALEQARDLSERAGIDEVGGLLSCGDIRRHNYTASVLLRTGDPLGAVDVAVSALASAGKSGRTGHGTIAQLRVFAAQGYLSVGDVDGAATILAPVLRSPTGQRLATVVRRVREIDGLITARDELRGHRAAGTLSAAIVDFCSIGAPFALTR